MALSAIIRTNNPTEFTRLDGVVIDERQPPAPIQGVANDVVCVMGEFQKGPVDVITPVGSTAEFKRIFGGLGPDASGNLYKGALALQGKRFGRLRVIRISNATQATATVNVQDASAADVLKVDAKDSGAYGNGLSVEVADPLSGDANHFDLIVKENGVEVERWRELNLADVSDGEDMVGGDSGKESDWIKASRIAIGDGRPANGSDNLATGSDGTFAAADYTGGSGDVRGIELLKDVSASGIRWVFVAEHSDATVNGSLKTLADTTKTKVVVINGPEQTATAAVTDVASYRSDRVIYGWPYVKVFVPGAGNGGQTLNLMPNAFLAALAAQTTPGQSIAGVGVSRRNATALTGIKGLSRSGTRNDYETFRANGIAAFVFGAEIQRHTVKSSVLASSVPGTLPETVERRTMADFLQESIAAELVNWQNLPLNRDNKLQVQAQITDFLEGLQTLGLLPRKEDLDLLRGENDPILLPFEVDITTLNEPASEAKGLFIILLKVRTFASMDFIVLRTEIGPSVEVIQEAA